MKSLQYQEVNKIRHKIHDELGAKEKSLLLAHSEEFVRNLYRSVFRSGGYLGDAIDAGANAGFHTTALAMLTRPSGNRVVAVEPNGNLVSQIRANCLAEQLDNFEIVQKGLFSKSLNEVEFALCKDDPQISQILHEEMPSYRAFRSREEYSNYYKDNDIEFVNISTVSLEKIVEKFNISPSFIKLDIEQSEYPVLMGSKPILDKFRPIFSVEVAPWSVPEGGMDDLFKFFTRERYTWVDFLGVPYDEGWWARDDVFLYWNRFLIPDEKLDILPEFQGRSLQEVSAINGFDKTAHESLKKFSADYVSERSGPSSGSSKTKMVERIVIIADAAEYFSLEKGSRPKFEYSHTKNLFLMAQTLASEFDVVVVDIAFEHAWRVKSVYPVADVVRLPPEDIYSMEYEAVISCWPSALIDAGSRLQCRNSIYVHTATQWLENAALWPPTVAEVYRKGLTNNIDYVITQNDRMKELFSSTFAWLAGWNFPERIHVLPLGFSEEEARVERSLSRSDIRDDMGLREEQIAIISAGGFWSWTDLDVFLEAFIRTVREGASNLVFFIMGLKQSSNIDHSKFVEKIEQIISENDDIIKSGNLRIIMDWKEAGKKLELWKYGADLGVNVSKETVENFQSHRVRFIEYMKAGIPVINTKGDSVSDGIGDAILFVVNSGSVDSYQAVLKDISARPELIQEKRRQVERFREHYQAEQIYKNLLGIVRAPKIAEVERVRMRRGVEDAINWAASAGMGAMELRPFDGTNKCNDISYPNLGELVVHEARNVEKFVKEWAIKEARNIENTVRDEVSCVKEEMERSSGEVKKLIEGRMTFKGVIARIIRLSRRR